MRENASPRVAILGLGLLGSVVARKAAETGLRVTAWDRTASHREVLETEHVTTAATPVETVRDADLVITILFDANAVLEVMSDEHAFDAMKPGATWLQMSTIGVAGTDRATALAATRPEIAFVDAPVSGSKDAAELRQLVVFASGDRDRAEAIVQPFFDAVAHEVHWLGAAGQGTRIGLLFNAWIGIMIESIAEVTTLAQALGIEPSRFVELVSNGFLVPPWALAKFDKIVDNRTADVEVPLRLAHKNVVLALDAAGSERPELSALDHIGTKWAAVIPSSGDADISALYLTSRHR